MATDLISRDLKDWPRSLRINVVTIDLAAAIYYSQCAIWGGSRSLLWEALSPERKAFYVTKAADLLNTLAPASLFEFSAGVARVEAARVAARLAADLASDVSSDTGGAR